MKGLGVIMTIAGAALGIIGYIKYSSWEYQLASAYGLDSSAEIMLYGGIGLLVLGLILLFVGSGRSGNSDRS